MLRSVKFYNRITFGDIKVGYVITEYFLPVYGDG